MSAGPVVIIGAGLAGLCCAKELVSRGLDVLVLEAQDCVGGRLRTDRVAGFQLDRGFQVLQTAYPEAQRQLDYKKLKLHAFTPGALIQTEGRKARMIDPWRRPAYLWPTVFNGVGTLSDRLKLAWLRWQVCRQSPEQLWQGPDLSTNDYLLRECGFSEDFVERFLRPWFSGVFLERQLATSSCYFKVLFRMFSLGDCSLPELGIGAIAEQLASCFPGDILRLGTRVESVEGLRVGLSTGEAITARHVVLAVDGTEASRLSNGRLQSVAWKSTTCLYYAAREAPFAAPILVLNADHSGPINSLCVPSNVCASYAPRDQALISVSVLGASTGDQTSCESAVRDQLRSWYGRAVSDWRLLGIYPIVHALPAAMPGFQSEHKKTPRLEAGLFYCGDYCQTGSIQGALLSGRLCAEAVLADC